MIHNKILLLLSVFTITNYKIRCFSIKYLIYGSTYTSVDCVPVASCILWFFDNAIVLKPLFFSPVVLQCPMVAVEGVVFNTIVLWAIAIMLALLSNCAILCSASIVRLLIVLHHHRSVFLEALGLTFE